MKTAIRLILTVFVFAAFYMFFYWETIAYIPAARDNDGVTRGVSLLLAILVSIFFWKKIEKRVNSRLSYIIAGSIFVGATAFVLGFFGPLILFPDNNLGPLLGIFITGPAGVLFGLFVGNVYWKSKVKNKTRL